jgi:hypothetical protein
VPLEGIDPVLLDFPLRGEWQALRTPAHHVPTHGTDFLGQRYAYDFVRRTGPPWAPFGPLVLAHGWTGVPVTSFLAWDAPVHAAHAGRIVKVADGWPDRRWVHAAWDLIGLTLMQRFRPYRITRDDWRSLAGNYVLIEGTEGVTMYAHLRLDSITVRLGDPVSAGDRIGAVGHSGRSTMPHLHFQLMDRPDGLKAAGVCCGFKSFDRKIDSGWMISSGIPPLRQPMRSSE